MAVILKSFPMGRVIKKYVMPLLLVLIVGGAGGCSPLYPFSDSESLVRGLRVDVSSDASTLRAYFSYGDGRVGSLEVVVLSEDGDIEKVVISKKSAIGSFTESSPLEISISDLPAGLHFLSVRFSLETDISSNENYGWYENSPPSDVDVVSFWKS